MEVGELAAQVRQNIERLRRELAEEESFLARLERYSAEAGTTGTRPSVQEPFPGPVDYTKFGLRVAARGEKKDLIRQIVSERPGRWSTGEMREALSERGIAADAGTPVKNVLWQLAQEGFMTSLGSGEYEFPARSADGDGEEPEEASV